MIAHSNLFSLFKHFFIILTIILLIFPILWMFSTSFKLKGELFTPDLRIIPHNPSLANYHYVIEEYPVSRWMLNSLIIAVGVTAGRIITSILAAYGFAVFDFPGKKLIFFLDRKSVV